MSEKADGIRAYWDGKKLYSKQGRELNAPSSFVSALPACSLDGELYVGNGSIHPLNATVISSFGNWQHVEYRLFDSPDLAGPYDTRLAYLTQLKLPKHVTVVSAIKCQSLSHLEEYLDRITTNGGEGIIARQP